jgi:hypothetical protein
MATRQTKETSIRLSVAVIVALWALLMFLPPLMQDLPFAEAALPVVDGFMRHIWVAQLYDGGGWYNNIITDLSAPVGGSLHWTHPLDILIIIGAQPLELFMETPEALFWSGAFVCPLLLLGCLFGIAWSVTPLVGRSRWLPACIMALFQVGIFNYASLGRADHHTLLLFFQVILVGAIIRVIVGRSARQAAIIAGLAGACGLWVSPEMALGLVPCVMILTWLWLRQPEKWLPHLSTFSISLLCATALVIPMEYPPSRWFETVYDKISFPYILLLASFALFWIACRMVPSLFNTSIKRYVLLGIWTAASLGFIFWHSPGIIFASLSQVDPRIVDIWLNDVGEMLSLWPTGIWELGMMIIMLGLGFIALPIILHRLFTRRDDPLWNVYLFLAIGSGISLAISLQHARFAALAELFFVMALVMPVDDWLKKLAEYRTGLIGFMEGALIVVTFSFVGVALGTPLAQSQQQVRAEAKLFGMDNQCEVKEFMRYLDSDARWPQDQKLIVGAHVVIGLKVVYHTRHQVVGTPYHRNGDAIFDTITLMNTPDPAVAKDIVRKRQMDMVVICDRRFVEGRKANPNAPKHFFSDLAAERIPPWLTPLDLSHIPDTGIRAFIVDKETLHLNRAEQPI